MLSLRLVLKTSVKDTSNMHNAEQAAKQQKIIHELAEAIYVVIKQHTETDITYSDVILALATDVALIMASGLRETYPDLKASIEHGDTLIVDTVSKELSKIIKYIMERTVIYYKETVRLEKLEQAYNQNSAPIRLA